MQIIIRGQKVKTELISKSLAHIVKDKYKPNFLNVSIQSKGESCDSLFPKEILITIGKLLVSQDATFLIRERKCSYFKHKSNLT